MVINYLRFDNKNQTCHYHLINNTYTYKLNNIYKIQKYNNLSIKKNVTINSTSNKFQSNNAIIVLANKLNTIALIFLDIKNCITSIPLLKS